VAAITEIFMIEAWFAEVTDAIKDKSIEAIAMGLSTDHGAGWLKMEKETSNR